MDYPSAPRDDLVEVLHGTPVADPYRWLEDVADPRTEEWSAAQDRLFAAARDGWAGKDWLRARLAELLAVGEVSVPVWRGERHFLVRREAGQEHGVLLVVEPSGAERTLVDPMAIDASGATTLDHWVPSEEGDRLAYLLSTGGDEQSAIRVLDVPTGELVEGPIDRAPYSSVAWLPGGREYFCTRYLDPALVPDDNAQLHRRVYRHTVGADPETDALVFGDGAPRGMYFDVGVSRNGRWLAVSAQQGTDAANDLHLANLAAPAPDFAPLQSGVDALTSIAVDAAGTIGYLWTRRDAPRGRICTIPLGLSGVDVSTMEWTELVAEDPEAVLQDFVLLEEAGQLLVSWRRHAVSELTVHDRMTGRLLRRLELPGIGSVGSLSARPEGGDEAWFSYTDFTTPEQVLRYDAGTGEVSLWAAPPGAPPAVQVATRQVTYPSRDGTPVRMFLIEPVGPPEPRPTILYGYGGFNISQEPAFTAGILTWVRAGGAYAVACLRGGSEEGETWHRAGMLRHKQNVFDDFHAAGDWLVSHGICTPATLGIRGGSNGGLLVGAALTQRPETYAAVVCSAPLLDMLRYERFGLGPLWTGEYGSVADPEPFSWLLAYSPYHNVRDGVAYPSVLFTVFEGDNRVDPLHARKLAAALQHASRGGPVLVRRERDVGHAGRAVTRAVDLAADQLAFLGDALRLDVPVQ
jgi:prolyl oligopeptidase